MADDVEQCRAALQECPAGHPDRSMSLHNLANRLHDRFQKQGVLFDLEEAIELNRASLALRLPGHPDRSMSLHTLADSLDDRFQKQGVLSDLEEAIELNRASLALRPSDHPDRSVSLNNLANNLLDRFERHGVLSDQEEAIELFRAALAHRPPGHSLRSLSLNNLAVSLHDRFRERGILSDLTEAIELHRAALAIRPPGHPDRSISLANLSNSIRVRFEEQGVPSDLDESIELTRAALALSPPGHSTRFASLNNLAIGLRARFEQQGVLSDLNESIELHRVALALNPPDHPLRSVSLNNLANSLRNRLLQQGVLSDLDEAIELNRVALMLRPPDHSLRSASLDFLAITLEERFQQQGILSDLEEAISLYRTALALPFDADSRSGGVLSDLDEAIELHRAALVLRPPGHSHRPNSLNNLADGLVNRFRQRSVLSDLNETIELNRAALALRAPGHSLRSSSLNYLANSLRYRFEQQGVLSDLYEAIELYRAALVLCPPGHSRRSSYLNDLANSPSNQLSQVSHTVSREDIRAAKSWAASAEQLEHGSVTLLFCRPRPAISMWSGRPLHFLAMDAFSCGVRHGALTTAVELVEQGRAVFWTQLARFRTPLDDLSASGDTGEGLAEEFKQVGFRLRKVLDALDASPEDQSPQIRQLTMQWNDVISRIRMLPDFSRCLLPPLFSDLQKAAEDGPVIIVNASQYSCDALIILSDQDPIHIALGIARTEVSELSSTFRSLTDHAGSSDHQTELLDIVGVLRELWNNIVEPIVQALRQFIPRGSRIWWCPTAEFTLLPLHAAGPYEPHSRNLSYLYISSYTPTLATLIRAREQVFRDASTQNFVAIGQANPDGGKPLDCVAAEVDIVAQRVAPFLSFTSLTDSEATVQGASDVLRCKQWLHLACHGMPNRKQPFDSSFAMHDGPLMIRDIIRTHLQNPEFAFLSACHTAVGHESSLDEAIHLAAAMQFSRFRSVIGSMWSVDDSVAGEIFSLFYDNLVDDSGRLDCKCAAGALHKTVKMLRKKIPFEQQIAFVHIGV
ncbi:TPR-like protein [Suillus paluster]|uniref:TPR-like protein n=1 Tax=Suillus paluster TaxID=48578 RepID=UPI001B8782A7|nr:TPR-like protein [Suillus paluster]KAG1751330.1 TPR-like protein [Suillus paluster]